MRDCPNRCTDGGSSPEVGIIVLGVLIALDRASWQRLADHKTTEFDRHPMSAFHPKKTLAFRSALTHFRHCVPYRGGKPMPVRDQTPMMCRAVACHHDVSHSKLINTAVGT